MKQSLLILLLGICLSSCRTTPPENRDYFEGEQISPEFILETVQLADGSTKQFISIEKSKCRARKYKLSKEYIGASGVVTIKPISECNLMMGYSPKEYLRQVNFMKWVQNEINMEENNGETFQDQQESFTDLSSGHSNYRQQP
jgi:hypothetical protein